MESGLDSERFKIAEPGKFKHWGVQEVWSSVLEEEPKVQEVQRSVKDILIGAGVTVSSPSSNRQLDYYFTEIPVQK